MKYEDWIKYERKRLRGQKRRPLLIHPHVHRPGKLKPDKAIAPNREAAAPPKPRPWAQFFRGLWGR